MRIIRATPLTILLAASVLACGFSTSLNTADGSVESFHALFTAARYEEIYRDAHQDFRKGKSEADAVQFLKAIHDRLGDVKQSQRINWRVFMDRLARR